MAIVIPTYVDSTAIVGFVGSVSATIQLSFSATCIHSNTSTASIIVPMLFSGSLNYGCALTGLVSPSVYFSSIASSYQNIQVSAFIEIPVYPYIRCTFGEDLSYSDCVNVLTKQSSVSVLQ